MADPSAAPSRFAADVRARWEALRERLDRAGAAVAMPRIYTATIGCLAAPAIDSQRLIPGNLGDFSIHANTFNDLTWAVFNWAYAGTARLHDNSVTQCLAGIWMLIPDSRLPTNNQAVNTLFMTYLTSLIQTLIFIRPWPVPAPSPPPADGSAAAFSLFLTNNQIEALPDGSDASAALVILANRPIVKGETTVSLAVSGNRLRSRNQDVNVPTALIVLPDGQQRSVVTGNLIFNEAHIIGAGNGPSLYVVLNSTNLVQLLAVVGNSLLGQTNLGALPRSGTPTDTWVPYNSILG